MRILIAHNRYQQAGGEDAVARTEAQMLKDAGHDVYLYERSNAEIEKWSFLRRVLSLWRMGWSSVSYHEMRKVIREFRPEVAHFHNIFFILTPSVYQACKDEGIPVVQSLHNFRMLCSNALFFRNNNVCEECLEKKSLRPGIRYGCYKNSRLKTALVVRMIEKHWKKGTWKKLVDVYVTATQFSRQKYIEAGIPEEKILIKPNIDYGEGRKSNEDKGYVLYVGRLSEEKGVLNLLQACPEFIDLPVKIVGDGPMRGKWEEYARRKKLSNVEFVGHVSGEKYDEYMRGAKFLIVPSVCYENFPRIIAEAFRYNVPVLASQIGSIPEIVENRVAGFLFKARDPYDLSQKVKGFLLNEKQIPAIKEKMRQIYEEKYLPKINCDTLIAIYREAMRHAAVR